MADTPSDGTKFKPGESVTCRIKAPEPGGYLVEVLPFGLEGFLPSQEPIDIGRQVPATFVCMSHGRALMAYAFMIGTTERVQLSTASDSENAFAVWADSYPRTVRMRRAIDVFMPPFASLPESKTLQAKEAQSFIQSLEKDQFTGCFKVEANARLSRSACLLYLGRAVGSVYTKKPITDPFPIEMALQTMVDDLLSTETLVESYELPDSLVLAMSAMFLGVLVKRPDDDKSSNIDYANQLISQFIERNDAACVTLTDLTTQTLSALAFVAGGQYKGAYSIEERRFRADRSYLAELFDKFSQSKVEGYIMPFTPTDAVKFGYMLSSQQFTKNR